jgi:alkanesulfonate monooxygenase SsuD/methylene tetrahydromethanopterin reductase-like flavin-dependent oxidoreductase (luciferase family)
MSLPCGGDLLTAQTLVDLAVELESVGWDGVLLEDYLVYYRGDDPATHDPWLVLTAVAARTSTLLLGTGVTGLLARDPVKLAREALTLRDLSGGRVVLGVGLGDPSDRGASIHPMWDAHRPRGEQMDERLDLLLALLAPPDPRSSGPRLQPLQDAGGPVPVWVGGSSQAGVVARRAARAQGVLPYKLSDTEQWSDFTSAEVAELARAVGAHRAVPGDLTGFDIAIGGRRRLASVEAERAAVDAAARGGATWWVEYVHPGPPDEMFEAVRRGPVRATAGIG